MNTDDDDRVRQVLVLGGTGFVGRAFCAQWVDWHQGGGPRLSVVTRRAMRGREESLLPTVDLIEANLYDDRALVQLLSGRQAVVNLVGILQGGPSDFARVHAELPRRLARACQAAGVRRVVHVSAIGAGDRAPSHYLRSKGAGEAALREAELDLTILRPSVMFGAEDNFLNMFAQLQRWFPVIPLAGAKSRYQPVWVDDVGQAIVRCLMQPHTAGKVFEAVGPREYTLADIVRAAGQWSGHARPIIPLPEPLARAQAIAMELMPGTPLMSRDNLDSMKVPSVASGGWSTLQALGIEPTPMELVAPQYLSHGHPPQASYARHG